MVPRDSMPRPRSRPARLAPAAVLLASLLCGCGRGRLPPTPRDENLVEIGTEMQLVADDLALERTTALRRQLNPLTKHSGNPILHPERPWEGQSTMPMAVLYDQSDRLFKMWYHCTERSSTAVRAALALSED